MKRLNQVQAILFILTMLTFLTAEAAQSHLLGWASVSFMAAFTVAELLELWML